MMVWDYYFIFDSNGIGQTLRCICKSEKDAIEALQDCYLDNKYNEDVIKQISFCLVFSYDSTTETYEFNKRETQSFIDSLPLCKQCNRIRNKLNNEGICSECENELIGLATFKCDLCKKRRITHDDFDRELFGKLILGNKTYTICFKCAEENYKPFKKERAVK
ncbi:hypothetical protein P344_01910 [Spiroplasma mirum ATCC 29335]|uniref:Uncharacterized protein n=1 Tax=Spiroplasma mirum ATCC 29335 TaxID=838561 RepID=W0GQ69_9MOLU|nr:MULTISPECIES: hypothetical protein [Spiroplasma]AHF60769.1 hypothetical protein SMM_0318 [Spiroplasma mirum ATCC 29335]AHI57730.1 hypothetical protein P344_01910 [Spiroplasma mirum ATCC 29335]AKM52887.1 hypothetical protein SATRI_v1c03600 [Spiroplasma atrichopogonis]